MLANYCEDSMMFARRIITLLVILGSAVGCGRSEPTENANLIQPSSAVEQKSLNRPSEQVLEGNQTLPGTARDSSLAIFNRRILPIFQSSKPSSCAECHLSGVDLKEYIRPSQQQTFASLVDAGLINVNQPDDSKILTFIQRRPEQKSLLIEEIREQEFEAFRAWIQAAVSDNALIADAEVQTIGSKFSSDVIRHGRKDRVLESFVENVWTEAGRCTACHSPDTNQEQVKEHGEQVSWISVGDPQATLDYMVDVKLIDTDEPEKSLLLMKPTLQLPHGGGQKMVIGDRTYKQFRRFIDDYTAIVESRYAKSDQLPIPSQEVSVVTDIWMKIEGVPAEYDKMLLQIDLHQQTDSGWSALPVATADRPVFGGGNLWQHSLSLLAIRETDWANQLSAKKLPPGNYLAKIYVDQNDKLQKNFNAELGEGDFSGQVQVESQWPAGYGKMTIIKFPSP